MQGDRSTVQWYSTIQSNALSLSESTVPPLHSFPWFSMIVVDGPMSLYLTWPAVHGFRWPTRSERGMIVEGLRKRLRAMFYGATIWDPWLIVAQIVSIQCLYYLSLGLLLSVFVGTQVPRFTLHYFFNYLYISGTSAVGWCTLGAFFLNAIAGAGYLLLLIDRAKKCLDFSVTLYIIHLIFCSLYGGFPSTITWWVVNILCCVTTALIAEWLCMRRELKDIPIRSTRLDV